MLRRHPWLPAALGIFTLMAASGLPTPLYPLYEDRWGFGSGVLTLIFATYVFGVVAVLLLVGRASDDVGRRPLLLAGLALGVVGTLVFVLASGTGWLFAGRALTGAGTALVSGAGMAALVELHPIPNPRFAAVAGQFSISAGQALGPLGAGVLAQWLPHPLRLAWVAELALLVITFLFVLRLPNDARRPFRRVLRPQGIRVPPSMRFLFFATAAGTLSISASVGLFGALAPTMLRELLHVRGPVYSGALLLLLQTVALSVTIGARRVEAHRAAAVGMLSGAAGTGLAALAAGVHSSPLFALATVLVGIGIALTYTGTLTAVNAAAPEDRRAEVVSGYYLAVYVGYSLPVVGVGFAADSIGLLRAVTIFASIAGAISVLAAIAMLRARGRTVAPQLDLVG